MFQNLLLIAVLVCALGSFSCASRKPYSVKWAADCSTAGARLAENWTALQEARTDPGGCLSTSGVDRCEGLRAEIERLALACPSDPPALLANAVLAYDSRQLAKAQQLLDHLLSLPQVHPEAAILRGRIALEEGNVPFALRFLEQQVRLSPDRAGLRELYASALFVAHDWKQATGELAIAERLGAPKWRVAYHYGLLEEAAGNLTEAARRYQEALTERPAWKPAETRLAGLKARLP